MLRGVAEKFRECLEMTGNKGEQTATRRDIKRVCLQNRSYNLSWNIIALEW
jgi:hypothetical protein